MKSFARLTMVAAFLVGLSGAETYTVDPVHSSFLFRIQHLGAGYTYGRFDESSGSFTLDSEHPEKNQVNVEVKTESIDTANADRDKHLRSSDFFDVDKFPTMTFRSASFKKKDATHYEVSGDLTIHGVTRPVSTVAEFTGSGKGTKGETRAGMEATFTIDRRDFGMNTMVGPVGAEVRIIVSLEGISK